MRKIRLKWVLWLGLAGFIIVVTVKAFDFVLMKSDEGITVATRLSYSPDGQQILFDALKGKKQGVYILDKKTSNLFKILSGEIKDPVFSSDGKTIAFKAFWDGNAEVYIINSDGRGLKRLTSNEFADGTPSFSPVENTLVFRRIKGSELLIILLNLSSGKESQIARFDYEKGHPFGGSPYGQPWFSNGKTVKFDIGVNEYTIDLADNNNLTLRKRNLEEVASALTASPDEKKLIFNRYLREGIHGIIKELVITQVPFGDMVFSRSEELFISDADGRNVKQLTHNGLRNMFGAFSPDGKRLIFKSGKSTNWGHYELWEVDVDGSNLKRVPIDLDKL